MMNGYGYNNGGGFDFFGWIIMMVVFAAVIVTIILVVRSGRRGMGGHQEAPLDVLKRRYANGEIDKREYEEKKKDLSE